MTKTKSNTSSIELNSYLFSLVYIVFALLFEVVQFSWLGFGILPKYFLFDFAIMVVIASMMIAAAAMTMITAAADVMTNNKLLF